MWSKNSTTLLNITCLALGIASCLFISNFIIHELSFDRFHANSSNLYRVETHSYHFQDITKKDALTPFEEGPKLTDEFNEISGYFRLIPYSENRSVFLKTHPNIKKKTNYVETAYFADPSIFSLLDIDIIEKREHLLAKTNNIAISAQVAEMLFPEKFNSGQSILGEKVRPESLDKLAEPYEVVAVFNQLPKNSHLHFDALFSIESSHPYKVDTKILDTHTYVLLNENVDYRTLNSQLYKEKTDTQNPSAFFSSSALFPFEKIHLGHQTSNQPSPPTSSILLVFLGAIGIIVLLLSTTNYANNSIIKALGRAKEVGIRKLLGVTPNSLRKSIFYEALLINLVAAILGTVIFMIGQKSADLFIDIGYPVGLNSERITLLVLIVAFLVAISTFLTASYPSYLLNSLKLTQALKGKNLIFQSKQSSRGARVMKGLLVFQLAMCLIFISGAYVVYKQLEFLKEKDNRNIVIEVLGKFPGLTGANEYAADLNMSYLYEAVLEEKINSFKVSNLYNGQINMRQEIEPLYQKGDSSSFQGKFILSLIDHNYWKNDTTHFISGTNFSSKFGEDYRGIIINESALEKMNFHNPESAIGAEVGKYNSMLTIKGVVQNETKNEPPMVYVTGFRYPTYFNISLNVKGSSAEKINSALTQFQNDLQYDLPKFYFITRSFENQSKLEKNLLSLFVLFTAVAIFIACIGVYTLSAFTAQKRTKEIGMRKILGATVPQVLYILIYDFIRLIFIGSTISIPLIVIGVRNWLSNFTYRIELQPLMLIVPILILCILSAGLIIKQSWKAIVVNPLNAISNITH